MGEECRGKREQEEQGEGVGRKEYKRAINL